MLYCMGIEFGTSEGNTEQSKLIQTLVDMRAELREVAAKTKNPDLFKIGDKYRDVMLNEFLVQIEDKDNKNIWK